MQYVVCVSREELHSFSITQKVILLSFNSFKCIGLCEALCWQESTAALFTHSILILSTKKKHLKCQMFFSLTLTCTISNLHMLESIIFFTHFANSTAIQFAFFTLVFYSSWHQMYDIFLHCFLVLYLITLPAAKSLFSMGINNVSQ